MATKAPDAVHGVQGVQDAASDAVLAVKVPGAHTLHSLLTVSVAFCATNWPAGHLPVDWAVHSVLPNPTAYAPVGHLVHAVRTASVAAYVPGGHGSGLAHTPAVVCGSFDAAQDSSLGHGVCWLPSVLRV